MTSWTTEQLSNARLIIDIGHQMGMSSRDIQAALVAAMQESSLRNLRSGDKDSAGLFQQRPSQGWGTYQQVTNTDYAIRKFYSALGGISDRSDLDVPSMAQAVQKSAYPGAYSKWLSDAGDFLDQTYVNSGQTASQSLYATYTSGSPMELPQPVGLPALDGITDTVPVPLGLQDIGTPINWSQYGDTRDSLDRFLGSPANDLRNSIIQEAQKYLGVAYKWGAAGPKNFDCSGLIYYVYNKLGIKALVNGRWSKIPRVSYDQALLGHQTDVNSLLPGDLVVFGANAHHIAIYLGNGRILEAPHTGANVRERTLGDEDVWGLHLDLEG